VEPLSQMFTSFMSVGSIPSAWKTAVVTPVFKKGASSDPSNYRPISQTSVFCKLMERVMTADITDYLLKHKLLSPQQHGFLAKRSTLTNLLETTNDWSITIDNKQINTVIYIDFSKAFDTVSHPKLLTKLQSCGITGDLLSVIKDFLLNRSQRTRVGCQLSNQKFLTSGVVQGSCLGPLLFLLFINDISTIFQNPITSKLYADDLKLYTTTETIHDSQQLQYCLDSLHQWSQDWQLTISIKNAKLSRSEAKRFYQNVRENNLLPSIVLVTISFQMWTL
jgi:Reverse transcriptase (RNA-dependent DNA polymerase)